MKDSVRSQTNAISCSPLQNSYEREDEKFTKSVKPAHPSGIPYHENFSTNSIIYNDNRGYQEGPILYIFCNHTNPALFLRNTPSQRNRMSTTPIVYPCPWYAHINVRNRIHYDRKCLAQLAFSVSNLNTS